MQWSNIKIWYILAALLLIPALLINLGLTTLNDDEAIRTLVAMEMDMSGNFIVPTLNGEFYRAKPPLYNWILWISFKIFGGVNEWSARLPNIGFLLLFGSIIYYYSKKHFSKEYSILNALLFITCGRILFWDSMLAYIDILYSIITFTSFMVIFHEYEKKNFFKLFIFSYILCALGFLLKGFPSLLFQAITLFVFFVSQRNFKKLLSIPHLVGIIVFAIIVGSYYYSYLLQQVDVGRTIGHLLDQSTRRTAIHEQYDWLQFFTHILTYPFENVYHFMPWSLMAIYMFRKGIIKKIKANRFLFFCAITFLGNIVIYWISVEVYPRYILMLIPLIFSIFLYFHKENYDNNSKLYSIFYRLHQLLFVGIIVASVVALQKTMSTEISYRYLKLFSGVAALIFLFVIFSLYRNTRLIVFLCALLILRVLFNWFVIPERHQRDVAVQCKQQAIDLGTEYAELPINIYGNSNMDLTSSVYLARTRNKITPRSQVFQDEGVTIFDTARHVLPVDVNIVGEICVREGQQTMLLVRRKN